MDALREIDVGNAPVIHQRFDYRKVFYSFSFPLHVVKNPVAKAYSVYAMIDGAYAVTAASKETWTGSRLISMQLAFQAYWVGGGLAGVGVSVLLPGRIEGWSLPSAHSSSP